METSLIQSAGLLRSEYLLLCLELLKRFLCIDSDCSSGSCGDCEPDSIVDNLIHRQEGPLASCYSQALKKFPTAPEN
jgi:hypothetical protein